MRFGVFSDVHGNAGALLRIWGALSELELAERIVLNAGDTVGYGSDPEACICFLSTKNNIVSVRGNYDRHVAEFPERSSEYRKKWGRTRPDKYAAIERDSRIISDRSREWLRSLRREIRVEICGKRVVVCHYSPGSKDGIAQWTDQASLERMAAAADADVVVAGHTHSPVIRTAGGVLFVNPGSVGRSSDPYTHYAVLDLDPGCPPSAELRTI